MLKHLKELEKQKQVKKSAAYAADQDLLSKKADFETMVIALRDLGGVDKNTSAGIIGGITAQLEVVKQSIDAQLNARVQQDMRAVIAKLMLSVRTMIQSKFGYAADMV